MHMIVAALMLLFVLAALLGVIKSHVLSDGLTFGTTSGSLAILAFVVAVKGFYATLCSCYTKCDVCSAK